MSQLVKSVKTIQVNNKCGICKHGRARMLVCGHVFHMKCLKKNTCHKCGKLAKTSVKVKSDSFDNTSQRMTTGSNGNAFITINQQDEWGRTTIIREIKKEKINDYMTTVKNNKDNKVNDKVNLGLMFMTSLMRDVTIKDNVGIKRLV